MPSLRERQDDILLLATYFIELSANRVGKRIDKIERKTLDLLQAHHWPGNIRELQNVVERAVILCDSDTFVIDESWLRPETQQISRPPLTLPRELLNQERETIEAAFGGKPGPDCRPGRGSWNAWHPAYHAGVEDQEPADQQASV